MREVCCALLLAALPCVAEDPVLTAIREAAASETPTLAFLQRLGDLPEAVDLSGEAVWLAVDGLGADAELPDELVGVLRRVEGLTVSGGTPKQVAFEFSEPFGLDLGEGYARLDRSLSFTLSRDGEEVLLDGFEGFKLSKSASSFMKVGLRSVRFGHDAEGAPIARIDAGLGGVHVKRLGPPPPPEVQGEDPRLTALLTRALQTEGSPILALLAGLPELAQPGGARVRLEREAIEASLAQALHQSGVDLERARGQELRTLRPFFEALKSISVTPEGDATHVFLDFQGRSRSFVSLGGDARWAQFDHQTRYTRTPRADGSASLEFGPGLTLARERYALRDTRPRPTLIVAATADGVPAEVVIQGGLVRGDADLALDLHQPGPVRPREGLLKEVGGLVDELSELSAGERRQLGRLFRLR